MGYVLVISLPVILLVAILALACYLLGRARGRSEASRPTQIYGPPAPPPQVFYPPPPLAQAHSKS